MSYWALILSLIGLGLGLISAYDKIKAAVLRAFRAGREFQYARGDDRRREVELLLSNVQILIAWTAHRILLCLGLALLIVILSRAAGRETDWEQSLRLVTNLMSGYFGFFLGDSLGVLNRVTKQSQKQ